MDLATDSLIGQPVFGGYVVTRAIGAGGMGEVYLVENTELHKKLVIKVLLAERSSNPELVARFLAEARAASALHHRNIVSVIDSARLPDRRHYILMEYLHGETLHEFSARKGLLSPQEALAVLAQVGCGLRAAHERGIIHRDIKPSNLIVTPQPDNRYFTKILDFGIAKLEDPTLAKGVQTKSMMIAGTPNYMSPEQARTLHNVDFRTDIYSLAAIAYELLTGRVPYIAHSVGELVFQQASSTPAPVSSVRPELPAAWTDLLARALSIEPRDRQRSMQAFVTELMEATPEGDEIVRAVAPEIVPRGALPRFLSNGSRPRDDKSEPPSPIRPGSVGVSGPEEMTKILRPAPAEDSDPPRISSTAGADEPTRIGKPRRPATDEPKTRVLPRRPETGGKTRVLPADEVEGAPSDPAAGVRHPSGPRGTAILPTPEIEAAQQAVAASPQHTDVLPVGRTSDPIEGQPPRSSALKWVLITAVIAGAIAAALVIGLFGGPRRIPDADVERPTPQRPAPPDEPVLPSIAPLELHDAGDATPAREPNP